MRKLKLDVERLTVESFPTSDDELQRLGTVQAREGAETVKIVCTISTIATNPTCCPCTP
ncbi:MAG TPA: hypothetical protein VF092_07865 [Longimicrobium sp.]